MLTAFLTGIYDLLGGHILLVGHASSLDVCSRQLIGKEIRPAKDMRKLLPQVPYCSLVTLEYEVENDQWELKEGPTMPVSHSSNARFDWKALI